MTDTLGGLYQESGINAQEQAALRHYASRVDANQTWNALHNYAKNHLSDPGWAEVKTQLEAVGEPEVPDFSPLAALGWQKPTNEDITNYRAQLDANGQSAGSYGEIRFTNTNLTNTKVRVVLGTDAEGGNVLQGPDGQVNVDTFFESLGLNFGTSGDKFYGQFAGHTWNWLQSGDENTTYYDLNTSLAGGTSVIGHSVASDLGVDGSYSTYTLNGSNLSVANGEYYNERNQDSNSVFRQTAEGIAGENFDMDNIQFNESHTAIALGGNAHYLTWAGEPIANHVMPPEGSDSKTIQPPMSKADYVVYKLSQLDLENMTVEEIAAATVAAGIEYDTILHIDETTAGPHGGNDYGFFASSDNPLYTNENTEVTDAPTSSPLDRVTQLGRTLVKYGVEELKAAEKAVEKTAEAFINATEEQLQNLKNALGGLLSGKLPNGTNSEGNVTEYSIDTSGTTFKLRAVYKEENSSGNVESTTTINVGSDEKGTANTVYFDSETGVIRGTVTYTVDGEDSYEKTSETILDNNRSQAPENVTVGDDEFYISGDYTSLQKVAEATGSSIDDLLAANPGLTEQSTLTEGTKVNLPSVDNGNSPEIVVNPDPTPETGPEDEGQGAQNVNAGYADKSATSSIKFINGELNASDLFSRTITDLTTGGVRPGAVQQVSNITIDEAFNQQTVQVGQIVEHVDNIINEGSYSTSGILSATVSISQRTWYSIEYTDPLMLDLTGNGIGTTALNAAPVLFDMDNSGAPNATAWADENTGILVVPDAGDVTGIDQMFSPFFGGTQGTNGGTGTTPFANGFDALAAQDSNTDGVIDSNDDIWDDLRVWVDADHDAEVDSGELKTLAELEITEFDLSYTPSLTYSNGNPVVGMGSFVMDGQTHGMSDVQLLSSPADITYSESGDGFIITAEDGETTITSYTDDSGDDVTLNANTLEVDNIYGGTGDNLLIANDNGGMLVGGGGDDTYQGGDGDDILVVSADDNPTNIDGGAGNDMLVITGDTGMTINMAQSHVELAMGGRGDDVIMSGGRKGVYIKGGSGNSLLIGGAGDDVIVGGSGKNTIIGGTGKAVIHAGPQGDLIYGAQDSSIIYAGGGADTIIGGAGDDLIKVNMGNATIDGGGGTNLVELHGSYADYRIVATDDEGYWIADKTPNRDGTVFIKNIQKLNFSDIQAVNLVGQNAMPVADTLRKDASGNDFDHTQSHVISVEQLTANDQVLSSVGDLVISEVSDAVGGSVSINQDGDVIFTPDATYTGLMSFKYTVEDSEGNPAMTVLNLATSETAPMRAKVVLATPDVPIDPLFSKQWYLNDVNVLDVWKDYTGEGIKVGQFEPGGEFSVSAETFDYNHADLSPNVNQDWYNEELLNATLPTRFSKHATLVAGVIAAAKNDIGAVGVAYNASIAGYYLTDAQNVNALGHMVDYDVTNNSWAYEPDFVTSNFSEIAQSILSNAEYAADYGRGGLGTVIVGAGGNNRESGGSAQGSFSNNNRFTIQTGAINQQGDLSTLYTAQDPFSNPGSSILISAPGSNIATTSQLVVTDSGSIFGNTTDTAQGTSFATPIVSGIAALMLEANPNLGYRDVQEIMALSAREVDDSETTWNINGAGNWNGGGMHASYDYGFGNIDALASVRLAETWLEQKIGSNEFMYRVEELGTHSIDAENTLSTSLSVGGGLNVEHVEVDLSARFDNLADLTVKIISPDGTESILVQNNDPDSELTLLTYTFMSTNFWGEQSEGDWTLEVTNSSTGEPVFVDEWQLRLFGSQDNSDDTYVYTNEFSGQVALDSSRAILNDSVNGSAGGINTINTAAVSADTSINLQTGSATIDGVNVTIQNSGDFSNIFTGDGDDVLVGSDNDAILDAGRGENTITGGAGNDFFVVRQRENGEDVIYDFDAANETIDLVGFDSLDFGDLTITQQGDDVLVNGLGSGQSILIKDVLTSALDSTNFVFQDVFEASSSLASSGAPVETLPPDTNEISMTGGGQGVGVSIDGSGVHWNYTGTSYSHDSATADYFVVEAQDFADVQDNSYNNIIDGFQPGVDKIDLSELGIASIDDLGFGQQWDFTANGYDVDTTEIYSFSTGTYFNYSQVVRLTGVAISDLSIGDFIFGPTDKGFEPEVLDTSEEISASNIPDESSIDPSIIASNEGVTYTDDGNGNVTVHSSVNYVLPETINILELTGESNIIGVANNNGNTLTGNTGRSTLIGGVGNDTYIINNSSTVIVENESNGTDAIESAVDYVMGSNVESMTLTGTDNINGAGNELDNDITGNSGNNKITGEAGDDDLAGGDGNDTYLFADGWGDDVLTENDEEGTDSLDFSGVTSSHNLSINLDTDSASYTGNSVTWTGDYVENAIGGAGNDTITGSGVANQLSGGSGNDSISAGSGNDVLTGGADNDYLAGGTGDDNYLFGNNWGSDTLSEGSGEGSDTIDFSAVTYDLSIDLVEHDADDGTNDLTWTGDNVENAVGGAGNDTITGNVDDNQLAGGTGDDSYIFADGWGNDTVTENASEGTDTLDFSAVGSSNHLTIDLDNDSASYGTNYVSWTGDNVENAVGGAGNDTITGNTDSNQITGGTGDDRYVLSDGWGSDTVTENTSEGTDTLDFSSVSGSNHLTIGLDAGSASYGTNSVSWTGDNIENAVGGAGNDTITGNSDANELTGNAGVDSLVGGDGNDVLSGGADNDDLAGGAGDDRYVFADGWGNDALTENDGEGTDTLDFSTVGSSNHLEINLENDTASYSTNYVNWTGDYVENAIGGAGNDTLTGNVDNNQLTGGTGDDRYVFVEGWGNDTVAENASEGTDTLDFSAIGSGNHLTIDLDTDTASYGTNYANWTGDNIENAVGGSGNDTLTGNVNNNQLAGGAGDDRYVFADGWGNDTVTENASEGTDTLDFSAIGSGNHLTIDLDTDTASYGTNDVTWTGDNIENVVGGAGNDSITCNAGANKLSGGSGDDSYLAFTDSSGADTIDDSTGTDVASFVGFDTTDAEWSALNDTDLLIDFGGGNSVTIQNYFDGTLSNPGTGAVESLVFDDDADVDFTDVQALLDPTITGTSGADTLVGTAGDDAIEGLGGNDELSGLAGNDQLTGGTGNDRYIFADGWGNDTVAENASEGTDTLDFSAVGSGNHLTIDLDTDTASYGTNYVNWAGDNVENAIGGAGNDTITGNADNNQLTGGDGDDRYVFADGWGNDTVTEIASEGTDTLDFSSVSSSNHLTIDLDTDTASYGTNYVNWAGDNVENAIGSAGNDTITGNASNNQLTGGTGDDRYVFADGWGNDTVTENVSEGTDTLDFSAIGSANHLTIDLDSDSASYGANSVAWTDDYVENAIGGAGNDTITGNVDNNHLTGGDGDDRYVFADGWGNDTVTENASEGTDTLDFSAVGSGNHLTIDLDSDSASYGANSVTWTGDYVENAIGGGGNDTITGNASNNQLVGGTGDDRYVFADGWGNDTVTENVSEGTDTLDFSAVGSANHLTIDLDSDSASYGENSVAWTGDYVENAIGGAGNDTITGNAGANNLVGGSGDDSYLAFTDSSGADTINDSTGTDVASFVGFDTTDAEWLAVNDTDLLIDFGGGNSVTIRNYFDGTLSNPGIGAVESLVFDDDADVDFSDAQALLDPTIRGTSGADTLVGTAGDDSIEGLGGNDELSGLAGNDQLAGGTGDDRYVFADGWGNDTVAENASEGMDTLDFSAVGSGNHLTIDLDSDSASYGSNYVNWTGDNIENAIGGAGNDTLTGYASDNQLTGGTGDDSYVFADGWGNDTVTENASEGTDTLDFSAVASNNHLTIDLDADSASYGANYVNWTGDNVENAIGGAGNDTITDNTDNNQLTGGTGDDSYVFADGWGNDTVTENVSEGTDTVDLSSVSSNLTVQLNGSSATDGTNYINWTAGRIEHVLSGSGNDTLTGYSNNEYFQSNDGDDTVNALAGNDTLDGGTGNDKLYGGDGNDVIYAGDGNDQLHGQDGDDSLEGGSGNDQYYFTGTWGMDTITSGETGGTSDYLDFNNGTPVSNDLTINLTPGTGAEVTDGAGNTVEIETGVVIERVVAGSGNDSIVGNSADNYLYGKLDDDTLNGGAGNDNLYGGDGAASASGDDTFEFEDGWGLDWITDNASDANTLDMEAVTSNLTVNFMLGGDEVTDGTNTINFTADSIIRHAVTGSGNDSIVADGYDNSLASGSGNDTLDAGAGNDTLVGGTGDDRYIFTDGWGNDTVTENASEGTDTLDFSAVGSGNHLTIDLDSDSASYGSNYVNWTGDNVENALGGAGNDTISGNAGNNQLLGGSGDDSYLAFTDSTGADTIDDSTGTDVASFVGFDTTDAEWSAINDTDLLIDFGGGHSVKILNYFDGTLSNAGSGAVESLVFDDNADVDFSDVQALLNPTLTGTSGADTLLGTAGDDELEGLGGNDELSGLAGNDELVGGPGDDRYVFADGWGNDTVTENASEGTDTLDFSSVTNHLTIDLDGNSASYGTNYVNWTGDYIENAIGGSGNDTITGNADANELTGNAGRDSLVGGDGNDTITGGADNDTMNGGVGDDSYVFADGFGNDYITDTSGTNTLDFSAITSDLTYSYTSTGATAGSDHVGWVYPTSPKFSVVYGGHGNDSITVYSSAGNVEIYGGEGNDSITSSNGDAIVDGGDGDDSVLSVGGSNNQISGGAGNDYFANVGSSNDTIDGGSGEDEVEYTTILNKGLYLRDSSGVVTTLRSSSSLVDILEGIETVQVNSTGYNSVYATYVTSAVDIDLSNNSVNAAGQDVTTVYGFDNITGSAYNDTLTGDSNANVLVGNDGDDTITGGAGNDVLYGYAGNDLYIFEDDWGVDSLGTSDDGVDTIDFSAVSADLTIALHSSALDEVTDGTNTANWSNNIIENVIAGSGNDSITGNYGLVSEWLQGGAGDDSINGVGGNDTLDGGAGNDNITGNSGLDSITGGDGDDTLIAAAGEDTLNGGSGNDSLDGGTDNDVYVFTNIWGVDTITDAGGVDTLDLSGVTNVNITADLNSGAGDEVSYSTNTINWDGYVIENYIGGNFNDTVTGTAADNYIDGGDGYDSLVAGDGNDTLIGGASNDTLSGDDGNDLLDGGTGSDSITAGSGNDTLIAGTGADTLIGGTGDDRYAFVDGWGNDTVTENASEGTDTLDFSSVTNHLTINLDGDSASYGTNYVNWTGDYIENAIGGSGNDTITGNDDANELTGNDGRDSIVGGDGNDTLTGGAGNDTLKGDLGDDRYVFTDGWGNDTVTDASGTNTMDFSAITSDLTYSYTSSGATAGSDHVGWTYPTSPKFSVVYGGHGNDSITVYSSAGNVEIYGGDGNDSITSSNGDAIVDGGDGDDSVLSVGGSNNQISGGVGNDYFANVGSSNDTIDGGSGDDEVEYTTTLNKGLYLLDSTGTSTTLASSSSPADTLSGVETVQVNSTGYNSVHATYMTSAVDIDLSNNSVNAAGQDVTTVYGFDNINGSAYNDTLTGDSNDNALVGNDGDDTITGGAGNDVLSGGNGNDYFIFADGWGVDALGTTDAGTDTLDFSAVTTDLIVDLHTTASDEVSDGTNKVNWSNSPYENFISGSGNDSISSFSSSNWIQGGAGDDTISGGGGTDTLDGGAGNDSITGGTGVDSITGGDGDDTLIAAAGEDTLDGGSGNDSLQGGDGNDALYGGTGNDTLEGENNDDILYGDAGDDSLNGGAGNDTLNGGGGNDNLWGGNDNDYLIGGDGDDSLGGNSGDDLVEGGAGSDVVDGSSGNDSLYGGDGDDYLYGSTGNDYMEGGDGYDWYIIENNIGLDTISDASGGNYLYFGWYTTAGVDIDLSGTSFTESAGNTLTWGSGNIQDITGSANADSITGDSRSNYINGGAGNDTLSGGDGDDYIYGSTGNDSLLGGNGYDWYLIENNIGTDIINDSVGGNLLDFYYYTTTGVDIDLSTDTSFTESAGNTLTWGSGDIADIFGSFNNDSLTGDSNANYLAGLGGADVLSGGGGNDTLDGGANNDSYIGFSSSSGIDTITDASGTDYADFGSLNTTDVTWSGVDTNSDTYIDQLQIYFDASNIVYIDNYFDNTSTVASTSGAGSGVIESLDFNDDSDVTFSEVLAKV